MKLQHREYLSTDKVANHRARTPRIPWRIFGKRSQESLETCKFLGRIFVHWNKGGKELLFLQIYTNWHEGNVIYSMNHIFCSLLFFYILLIIDMGSFVIMKTIFFFLSLENIWQFRFFFFFLIDWFGMNYWNGLEWRDDEDIFADHRADLNDARVPHRALCNDVNFANGPRRCV